MMPGRRANPLRQSSGREGFFEEIVSARYVDDAK
jgi:hypothetical protein